MGKQLFGINEWEESDLLIGLNQKEKKELVEKFNKTIFFLNYKGDDLRTYVQNSSLHLVRKIYGKVGNDFDVHEILTEFNNEAWEEVYNSKLKEVSDVDELQVARKELMNDFVKTFN